MLAKLRLDQTAVYEQAIAAYEISKMICAFAEGRKHILCIGSEQGDIIGWDDFVIQDCISEFTHLQIKRQQTDFAPLSNCTRNGDTELTPLDRSMLSLATWILTYDPTVNFNKYHFKLCLPNDSPDIKRNLGLRNFREFMSLNINETTTSQGLEKLQNVAKDGAAINVFNWLTTWCDFRNWDHINRALQRLEIFDYRLETEIDSNSVQILSQLFSESEKVLSLIKIYTQRNSAYTGSISPRQLLFELKEYLLPNKRTWTQIDNLSDNWQISGIHDLESNTEIERPSRIIPLLWSNERVRNFNINIGQVSSSLAPIHEGIFQLAIHIQGTVNALCVNWDGWKVCLESKLGGTLGNKEDDLDSLTISSNNAPYKVTDGMPMNSNAEQEIFAKAMTTEMTKATWEMVTEKVSWRISKMDTTQSQELRDAVELRWNDWQAVLGKDKQTLATFFRKAVHPNAEGQDILGHLRIGPKTKLLIGDALFTCLLVSVALDPGNSGIMKTGDGLSIGAIGLNWWSGPAGKIRRVRRIDEEESVNELIGKESYDILILSQSEQPESEVYKEPLGESAKVDYSLAAGRKPKLLVTRNRLFGSIINRGSINELRDYLQQKLVNHRESLTETLNNNAS
ncbi:MAG: ABC-three component system protein [Ferruginibacter sp.]